MMKPGNAENSQGMIAIEATKLVPDDAKWFDCIQTYPAGNDFPQSFST